MLGFLLKLLPKNLAGVLGIAQLVIPLLRELIMVVLRLLAIFMKDKITDDLIAKVKSIADKIESGFDKVKRVLLGIV